jgi:hypothetical protein
MCDWNSGSAPRATRSLRQRHQRAHVAVQLVLRAVVGVQRDVDGVLGRDHVREVRQRHCARHHVLDRARQILGTAGRYLDDPVTAGLGETTQRGVQRLARGAVDRGEREAPLLGSVEHLRVDLWGRDWHDDDSSA